MKWVVTIVAVCCGQLCCSAVAAAGPFPRLLPPVEEFRLTLREEPHSTLPLVPSCTGEAGLTLTCRAFILTLENVGKHTVHISGFSCAEPDITVERKQSNSSSAWWLVSQPTQLACPTLPWTNLRLKPGERTQYATRLISPRRSAQSFASGSYTLRAMWALFGCTEASDGTDCLSPLQVIREGSSVADVALQEPVSVVSNEVTANSPPLHDLGALRFAFEVTVHHGPPGDALSSMWAATGCTAETRSSIDCTVFHYTVRNLGDRAVRNATASCSDSGITPEYATAGGEWKPVPQKLSTCWSNITIETKILPGRTIEGEFMLTSLAPPYDTTPLRAAGEYRLRFMFRPHACFASPDASFCLLRPENQPSVVSQEIALEQPPLALALHSDRP